MENLDPKITEIVNFIFNKPEVVVKVLQENGYPIVMSTTTLQEIEKLTFEALNRKDEKFDMDLSKKMKLDKDLNLP
jgi:uncharacterized lipoprotein